MRRALTLLLLTAFAVPVVGGSADAVVPPTEIVVVGGSQVVGDGILEHLESCTPGEVRRVAGPDRYATAAEISKDSFPSAETVYLATGRSFPDALTAGPVAAAADAPVLLIEPTTLPAVTLGEIDRLGATTVVLIGGEAAIAPAVADELAARFPAATVERIAGSDRFETAALLSQRAFPGGIERVFIATGRNFPDALAAGPMAASTASPILLVERDSIPSATEEELARLAPSRITVLGGTAAVSSTVTEELGAFTAGTVERLSGFDRYATAAEVVGAEHPGPAARLYIATGASFPDALALAPATGGDPLLLVDRDQITTATADRIWALTGQPCEAYTASAGHVLAIGDSVMRGVACNPAIPPCYSSINLESAIEGIESNAAVSRQFFEGRQVLVDAIAAGRSPDTLVVHLGTNGPPNASQFDDLMEAAADVDRVFIVTVKVDRSYESQVNAVLRAGIDRHPKAELVDWYALASANPSWLAADATYGAHLWTNAARVAYVDMIAEAVGS